MLSLASHHHPGSQGRIPAPPTPLAQEFLVPDLLPLFSNTDIVYADLLELERVFTNLLRAQTQREIQLVLYTRGIKLEDEDIQFETDVTPKHGKPIPESWHHRLDQDINNLFHPEEWVGYEDGEGYFVFAQIIHPVVADDSDSSQDVGVRFRMRYKIYISENDEEGIEVSGLDLYKFLRGKKAGKHVGRSKALVPYEGETDDSQPRREAETELKSIKRQRVERDLEAVFK